MAILVNLGKRGFVLKQGFLNPGESIVVDAETAETLSRVYPQEIKVVKTEEPKIEPLKVKIEEKPVVADPEVKTEEVKPEQVEEKPKRTYKRKAK